MNLFGSLLSQIKPFFDGRDLVTVFAPSLVAWTVTAVVLLLSSGLLPEAVAWWDTQDGVARAMVATGFVVWVLFWSYLTLTARPWVLGLYSGNAGDDAPSSSFRDQWIARIYAPLLKARQQEFDALTTRDRELEAIQAPLIALDRQAGALVRSRRMTATDGEFDPAAAPGWAGKVDPVLLKAISAWGSPPAPNADDPAPWPPAGTPPAPPEELSWAERGIRVLGCWAAADAAWSDPDAPDGWKGRKRALAHLTRKVITELPGRLRSVERERQKVTQQIFLQFPADREDLHPTRLGNVLRTADAYPFRRYGLDATVAWPRLAPSLDAGFATALQKTRTTMELMLTLSAFAVLFGVPLTLVSAFRMDLILYALAPATVALVAFLLGHRWPAVLAGVALFVTLGLEHGSISRVPWKVGLHLGLFGLSVSWLLALVTYRGALMAAGPYAEKLKSAFDLYRWKLLEALKLQLPDTRKREKRLWTEVGQLLYRGAEPDGTLFRYEHDKNVLAPPPRPVPTADAVVAQGPIPAFRTLTQEDVAAEAVPRADLPQGVFTDPGRAVGRCPLVPLAAGAPLSDRDLVDADELAGLVSVGVPATPAMTLGGTLARGDRVDVSPVERADERPWPLSGVLVLGVHEAEDDDETTPASTVVLGLPRDRAQDYLHACAGGQVVISRSLSPGAPVAPEAPAS